LFPPVPSEQGCKGNSLSLHNKKFVKINLINPSPINPLIHPSTILLRNLYPPVGSAKIVKRIQLTRINQVSTLKFYKCLNLNKKNLKKKAL
jgi:hypothetical protein